MIGVSSEEFQKKIAEVLKKLGTKRSLIVTGHNGLDEISLSGLTKITEVNGDSLEDKILQPSDFGFRQFSIQKILDYLNVPSNASDMSFAMSVDKNLEYSGSLIGMLANYKNLIDKNYHKMIYDIFRFFKLSP